MRFKTRNIVYTLMILPGMILLVIFSIIPMFGVVMAFQKYVPTKGILGSEFVGLEYFEFLFQIPDIKQIIFNTVFIATSKIILNTLLSVILAIMLYEVGNKVFKKTIQTIIYIPHFLSWVAISGILLNIFDLNGPVNGLLSMFGVEEGILFFADGNFVRPLIILTDVIKEAGFGTIVYLAALSGINPNQYEVARLEGASRLQRVRYIMLPGMAPTILLLLTLNIGNIMNANFDQIFNLYNPLVYDKVDILDTFVYRMGLESMQFSFAAAVGLLKSCVGLVLMVIAHKAAEKFANYRIF
ncbi:MAG: ABC transporter permease subunit [Lachnospiraceae bacterium]|nr:ABC transporter permease subunit [Lachnospiraceae bacterium]